MIRTLMGAIIATLVVFFWGFAFWGASDFAYQDWQESTDDHAAQAALRQYFPLPGTYHLPARSLSEKDQAQLLQSGPNGFLHLSYQPRDPVDMNIMVRGLLLNATFALLLAIFLYWLRNALPSYSDRVACCAIVGLLAVTLIDFGDVVWWNTPLSWRMWVGIYDFSVFLIAGLVLAAFVPKAASS